MRRSSLLSAVVLSFALVAHTAAAQSIWANVPMPGGSSTGGADCSPTVQQHQNQIAVQQIAGQVALARQSFTPLPQSMSAQSCLPDLSGLGGSGSGLNLDSLFNPPSLSSLLNGLVQQACTMAKSYLSKAEAPLAGALGSALGSAGGGLGSAIPGFSPSASMGSILSSSGGGMSTNPGANLSRINLMQTLNGGYTPPVQPYNPTTFGGGLFSH
jgi:hypothetical protein